MPGDPFTFKHIIVMYLIISSCHKYKMGDDDMKFIKDYDRRAAVIYAHKWAYSRNPLYLNYDNMGGDCTNFVSQCLFEGSGVMNFTPIYGWYYINGNKKAPAWTGAIYLYNFLTRRDNSIGPKARECDIYELQPGDLVQLSITKDVFHHSAIVVASQSPFHPKDILVAAHTDDSDYCPISTYRYRKIRFLHIEGVIQY